MTLEEFARLMWRWRALIVSIVLAGAVGAFAVSALLPKVFTGVAVNFVTAIPGADRGASYDTAQFAVSRAKSYSPIVDSPAVLNGVIQELGLDTTADDLAPLLSAENPAETTLIKVYAEGPDPDLAQRMANSASRHLATEIETLETGGSNKTSPVDIQLAVPATPPRSPSEPRTLLNVVMGALIGFVVAMLLALYLRLDRLQDLAKRVRTRRQPGLQHSAEHPQGGASPAEAADAVPSRS